MVRTIGRVDYPTMLALGEKLVALTQETSDYRITTPLGTERGCDPVVRGLLRQCDQLLAESEHGRVVDPADGADHPVDVERSEERRVGKECRSWWWLNKW